MSILIILLVLTSTEANIISNRNGQLGLYQRPFSCIYSLFYTHCFI